MEIIDGVEMKSLIDAIKELEVRRVSGDLGVPSLTLADDAHDPHSNDDNPMHLEDFKNLLDAAAKKTPQAD